MTNARGFGARLFDAIIVAVVVLGVAILLSIALGAPQRDLAARVDRNAEVSRRETTAIICILQLGVDPKAPPRTTEAVRTCITNAGLDPDTLTLVLGDFSG